MNRIKIFLVLILLAGISGISTAQPVTETLKVSGECGMCKKKIEKAAKEAGASFALWNVDTKMLTVKYVSSSTNKARIEAKIAGVGYDTPDVKATDEAYNKLDQCCMYERESGPSAMSSLENNGQGLGQGTTAVVKNNSNQKEKMSGGCCSGGDKSTCKDADKSACKDGDKSCCKKKEN